MSDGELMEAIPRIPIVDSLTVYILRYMLGL